MKIKPILKPLRFYALQFSIIFMMIKVEKSYHSIFAVLPFISDHLKQVCSITLIRITTGIIANTQKKLKVKYYIFSLC